MVVNVARSVVGSVVAVVAVDCGSPCSLQCAATKRRHPCQLARTFPRVSPRGSCLPEASRPPRLEKPPPAWRAWRPPPWRVPSADACRRSAQQGSLPFGWRGGGRGGLPAHVAQALRLFQQVLRLLLEQLAGALDPARDLGSDPGMPAPLDRTLETARALRSDPGTPAPSIRAPRFARILGSGLGTPSPSDRILGSLGHWAVPWEGPCSYVRLDPGKPAPSDRSYLEDLDGAAVADPGLLEDLGEAVRSERRHRFGRAHPRLVQQARAASLHELDVRQGHDLRPHLLPSVGGRASLIW
eukprot:1177398-Prorocentrum_minimum.AAC.2